jgi:hypothetical protein
MLPACSKIPRGMVSLIPVVEKNGPLIGGCAQSTFLGYKSRKSRATKNTLPFPDKTDRQGVLHT